MELSFNAIVIIVIVVLMLLIAIYFYLKIKESGVSTLEQILNIPDFLKKIFGGG
ncbi:MAG: hypothetical protein QW472_02925 [Candidatus Aenigmatarchaeota archaeon]